MTDVLGRKTPKHSVLIAVAASAWLALAPSASAQEIDEAKALRVKAAYLYNFAKFIEWPADAFEDEASPFVIGVLGDDPFGRNLDATVEAKKIARRPVKILRLSWSEQGDRAQLRDCHVLYVSNSERHRLREVFATLADHPVLLVADVPGFADDGGGIGFVLEKQRIIFEINREALERSGLRANAKLLQLARIVRSDNQGLRGSRTGEGKP